LTNVQNVYLRKRKKAKNLVVLVLIGPQLNSLMKKIQNLGFVQIQNAQIEGKEANQKFPCINPTMAVGYVTIVIGILTGADKNIQMRWKNENYKHERTGLDKLG